MMAESEDGRWAADTTGRAASRQNGKGDEIEVVELWGLAQRSEAILHTAHEAATAASAHGRMIGLVEGHRDLRVKIKKKQSWNGNYSLHLSNDGMIVWRTRTGAGGRGLDDISRIVIDEAQHAQPEELASSLPILSVNPNPQKNFMGSGGVSGKSAFWWRQRRRALAAVPGRFAWLEHSAEDIVIGADGRLITSIGDVANPETWRRANPAYPSRISHDFLLDQLETLGPGLFAREHLCVWDAEPDAGGSIIDAAHWVTLAVGSKTPIAPVLSVEVALDRSRTTLGAAWLADKRPHVEVFEDLPGTGVVPRMVEHQGKYGVTTAVLDSSTEAASLAPALEAAGFKVLKVTGAERAAACAGLFDLASTAGLSHNGDPALATALANARWKDVGEGARVFSRRKSSGDIAALYAVTLALYGLTSGPKREFWGSFG